MNKALAIAIAAIAFWTGTTAPASAEPFDPSELDRMLEGPIPAEPLTKMTDTAPTVAPPLAPPLSRPAASRPPTDIGLRPSINTLPSLPPVSPSLQSLQGLPNFRLVSPQLLRGGQPTADDLAKLKAAGVKTVINLRNEETLVKAEAKQARALGLNFINIPLDVFNPPSEQSIQRFLKLVDDQERQPIYVHCLHGQDRTGTMIAIYRIDRQGWNADQAYSEMVTCGFRPGFANLTSSVFAHGAAAGRPGTPPSGGDIMTDLKKRFSHSR